MIYTSDQGFFLGDHGWYDKRFMYEESLRMPFLIRYPREVAPGSVNGDMILNVDFPATFLDCAGVDMPSSFQGRSFRPLLRGETPADCRRPCTTGTGCTAPTTTSAPTTACGPCGTS